MSKNAVATATGLRTYQIDKAHTDITFQVRHLISKVRGRFNDFSGTVSFDAEHPEKSSAQLDIAVASIDTSQPDRDAHLRNADFFDVERYPQVTFRSTSVVKRSEQRYDVTGDLTIHGVTRSVVLPVDYLGEVSDPWGNVKVAFETTATINRGDFGLTYNAALEVGGFLIGDEVKIEISAQAQ